MFGTTYKESVTIRRAAAGTLGVSGRPEYEKVLHEDDQTPVAIVCKIQERGRITIDARQRQIKTDATLLYCPAGLAILLDNDIVVRADGRAYQIVGIETLTGQWGGAAESRVDLVKTTIAVPGGVA